MCFSPEVDLVAGVVISAIGVDALRHVEHRTDISLAALPLALGTHQIIEAVVWWGVEGRVASPVGLWAAWLYLVLAFGALPWLVPWAVSKLEPNPGRSRAMVSLAGVGVLLSTILMYGVIRGPVVVADGGHFLSYQVPLPSGGFLVVVYIVVTCGSLLLSTDRRAVQFGVANLTAVIALALLLSSSVISLWCVWAAVASGVVAIHMRRTDAYRHRFRPIASAS